MRAALRLQIPRNPRPRESAVEHRRLLTVLPLPVGPRAGEKKTPAEYRRLTKAESKETLGRCLRGTAQAAGVSAEKAAAVLHGFFEQVVNELCKGRLVMVPGFGTFGADTRPCYGKDYASPVPVPVFVPNNGFRREVKMRCAPSEEAVRRLYYARSNGRIHPSGEKGSEIASVSCQRLQKLAMGKDLWYFGVIPEGHPIEAAEAREAAAYWVRRCGGTWHYVPPEEQAELRQANEERNAERAELKRAGRRAKKLAA